MRSMVLTKFKRLRKEVSEKLKTVDSKIKIFPKNSKAEKWPNPPGKNFTDKKFEKKNSPTENLFLPAKITPFYWLKKNIYRDR